LKFGLSVKADNPNFYIDILSDKNKICTFAKQNHTKSQKSQFRQKEILGKPSEQVRAAGQARNDVAT